MSYYIRLFPILLLLLCYGSVAGANSVVFGAETFNWREYRAGGVKIVDEEGYRQFLALTAERRVGNDWLYGFYGKLYFGDVDYDGQKCNLLTDTCEAASGDTNYAGVQLEADFYYAIYSDTGDSLLKDVSIGFSVGYDTWRRDIKGDGGYTETYNTLFSRFGADAQLVNDWRIKAGVKYPFYVGEEISIFDNITLAPVGEISLFLTLNGKLSKKWGVHFYYDSYRFGKSATETVANPPYTDLQIHQPESHQDTFGLGASYHY